MEGGGDPPVPSLLPVPSAAISCSLTRGIRFNTLKTHVRTCSDRLGIVRAILLADRPHTCGRAADGSMTASNWTAERIRRTKVTSESSIERSSLTTSHHIPTSKHGLEPFHLHHHHLQADGRDATALPLELGIEQRHESLVHQQQLRQRDMQDPSAELEVGEGGEDGGVELGERALPDAVEFGGHALNALCAGALHGWAGVGESMCAGS
jgi:hypothetical protein